MMTLRLPTAADREDVLSFYREFEAYHGTCIGFAHRDDYDTWLRGMQNRHTGTDLPEGYVREDFLLCYDGTKLIGVFSLKYELTDYLLHYGGHVGYAVRPTERNRGYGTEILRRGTEMARSAGFTRILAICDEDNRASECVILKNGGVLENTLFDPEERVTVKRYWISL